MPWIVYLVPIFIGIVFCVLIVRFFMLLFGFGRIGRIRNQMLDVIEQKLQNAQTEHRDVTNATRDTNMKCDNCGGVCENGNDISPNGDVKCEYCGAWYNVWRDEGLPAAN